MSNPVHTNALSKLPAVIPDHSSAPPLRKNSKTRPRHNRKKNKSPEDKYITQLNEAWGRTPWLPPGVRPQRGPKLGPHSLRALLTVTQTALDNGIHLEDIWKTGHYMRKELPGDSPTFTILACRRVIESIEADSQRHSVVESILPSVEEPGMNCIEAHGSPKSSDEGGDPSASDHRSPHNQDWVDLTQDESPDPHERPTKRLRQDDTLPSVDKLQHQLTNEVALSDDVMDLLSRVLINLTPPQSVILRYPLWFQDPDWNQLPSRPRSLNAGSLLCFPIHHKEPLHWTLAIIRIDNDKAICTFYDSIGNEERAQEVEARLRQCMGKWAISQELLFERPACAQQDDGTSCGVIVLSNMLRILRGQPVPKSIEDPSMERQTLLSLLCNADGSRLSPEENSLLNDLRKHAIMQASQDKLQELIRAEEQRLMKATHAHSEATAKLSQNKGKAEVMEDFRGLSRSLKDQISSGYENTREGGAPIDSSNNQLENEEATTPLRAVRNRLSYVMDKALKVAREEGHQEGVRGCLSKVDELATGIESQIQTNSDEISQCLADIEDATKNLRLFKEVYELKQRLDKLDTLSVYRSLSSHT
ncbi:hypothetical protein BGZ61DRAFT_464819 [Ilyonectria robusta]|uniref:uncharacterized protein n=1 Tax=Ilyonectria robusta TaxID=1079257 RepID=UPI001E8D9F17|nr:uncharacterized protein BGZ61DRAFT_464819 [Ilyonectria robusta]KAH8659665.1 hypothetical protein BGZ61DRAFT_464819 [Ilyonectria robusta]